MFCPACPQNMKIVFRLNYYTRPGQSLWIKVSKCIGDPCAWDTEVIPMEWLNEQQWQAECDVDADEMVCLRYRYEFRQEGNEMELEEWGDGREVSVDPANADVLFLRDDWKSAGTVDYAFETMAFRLVLPEPHGFSEIESQASHEFRLTMAAVPEGCVPCLLGDVDGLHNWNRDWAIPLQQVSANDWRVSLDLPHDRAIEYKYGLCHEGQTHAFELEMGENRVLEAHHLRDRQMSVIQDEAYRREPSTLYRSAGVAVPVFSLRSEKSLGVGEFADLKDFADWAHGCGLKMIQILPVNDTTSSHNWTDSYPYSAISVFALHPIYLRIEDIGLKMSKKWEDELGAERDRLNALDQLDHEQVMAAKHRLLRQIYQKHGNAIRRSALVQEFRSGGKNWLVPYAAFCVNRDRYKTADFAAWKEDSIFDQAKVNAMMEDGHPDRDEMYYHIWLQSELDRQLKEVSSYLRSHGVALKGDLPIGIDRQSADAWSAPHLFHMDSQAGAPPDAFSGKGQNWGFPTYNWDLMRENDYAWWCARFDHLSIYFDAFRIDHILGFFRIWQVPIDHVEGIMGWFDPALPVRIEEFEERGIAFDRERFCEPYITDESLVDVFGELADEVIEHYLKRGKDGRYQLREAYATQRKVHDYFWRKRDKTESDAVIRQGLMDCISDVLFFEDPGSGGTCFHPRFFIHKTHSFAALDAKTQEQVDAIYVDYFFMRQDGFWQARGVEKLPAMRKASEMLLCGEDLGMVPACVPGVMKEQGILSLEIQRMPKNSDGEFSDPMHAPYLSVVSPSTHDMSTLREWWREDVNQTGRFAWYQLNEAHPPEELTGELVEKIIRRHLESPAMLAVFPLQDLLAMDEGLRHPDPRVERINVPAIMPYNWRYRMHLNIEQLLAAEALNHRISAMLAETGR